VQIGDSVVFSDSLGTFIVNGESLEWDMVYMDWQGYGTQEVGWGPGIYPITLRVDGDVYADNYVAVFDNTLTLVVNASETSISKKPTGRGYGILLETNPISGDSAQIKLLTPESVHANVKIYDAVGNIVHNAEFTAGSGETFSWNLTNKAGRIVANGSYLVIVEARGHSGKIYRYSARLGIKR
jgi:hypothetical protein